MINPSVVETYIGSFGEEFENFHQIMYSLPRALTSFESPYISISHFQEFLLFQRFMNAFNNMRHMYDLFFIKNCKKVYCQKLT